MDKQLGGLALSWGERTPRGKAFSIPSHAHARRRTRTHTHTHMYGTCIHMYTHTYVHTYAHAHIRTHTHVHNACTHVCTQPYTHARTQRMLTHIHTHTQTHKHARTRTHAHTRTHAYVRAHTRVHTHVGTAHRARRPSHRLALCLLIMCCPPRIARIGAYQLGFSNLVTVQYGIRSYIAYIYGSGQPYEHEQAPAVLVRIIEMDL